MKIKRLACLGLGFLLLLSAGGCGRMLEREYEVTRPHTNQYTEVEGSDALRAENYTGMKNAILYFITEMDEYGVIDLYNYSGDVASDLAEVCVDIVRSNPLGAFAVDYIVHDYTKIVSHYELHIYLTYRCTREEMSSIISVSSPQEAYERLERAYLNRQESLILQFSVYSDWLSDAGSQLSKIYYAHPEAAFLQPEMTYSVYPEAGLQRIVELKLRYPESPETLETRQTLTDFYARRFLTEAGLDSEAAYGPNTARQLYDALRAIEYDHEAAEAQSLDENAEKDLGSTAYGVFANEKATSEGIALAYKLLCDKAGVECQVVSGKRQNAEYYWNIIRVDEAYYHVDCAAYSLGVQFDGFMGSDESFGEYYRWNTEQYPACNQE